MGRERKTFVVNVKGPEDRRFAYLVSGVAMARGIEVASFRELETFSSDMGKPVSAPSYVISESSFTIRKAISELIKELERTLGVSPKTSPLTAKLTTWDMVSAELRDNSALYKMQ